MRVGLHVPLGKLLARAGELLLDLVAGRLARARAPARVPATCSASDFNSAAARFRSMAVLAASRSSRRYLPESTTRSRASSSALQLGIAPRLGGLPLERIHLAGDFLQDVVDARQVLLGAFQLGFRQALARLELGDAGGFFDDRRGGPAAWS